jgi:cation-transporting ATPase I
MWLIDEVRRLPGALRDAARGTHHRRRWVTEQRAHIELRSLADDEWPEFVATLEDQLAGHAAVLWAEVHPLLRRVVVSFESDKVSVDELEAIIERVERAHDVDRRDFAVDGRQHPADHAIADQELIALTAAAIGVGVGLVTRVVRVAPPPVRAEIGALGALVQESPQLKHLLERRYRPPIVDLGLSVVGDVATAIAAGPVAPIVEAAHRVLRLAEDRNRQAAWVRREAELFDTPGRVPAHAPVPPRPVPLPPGPVQHYLERSWLGGVAAAGAALLLTRGGDRMAAAISATTPRAAHLGPEAFGARLGDVFADRDVLVLDRDQLRLFDRVDCLVVEADLLFAPQQAVHSVHVVGDVSVQEARRHAALLFDPDGTLTPRRDDAWTLRATATADPDGSALDEALEVAGSLGAVLTLFRNEDPAAYVATRPTLAPGAAELLAEAGRAELRLVVLGTSPELGPLAGTGEVVLPEEGLAAVRALQEAGHVVAAVAAHHHTVLAAADCSLGLTRSRTVPWGAGMVARESLADAYLLALALGAARRVSRQSITIALVGAGAALFLAFGGLVPGSTRRATDAVNLAAAVAMVNGTRAAVDLANRPLPGADTGDRWHALDGDTVIARLGTSRDGLSSLDAERRLPHPARVEPAPLVFARAVTEELGGPLTPVLAAGAAISALTGAVGDAVLVLGVVAVDALIGGLQRYRTERDIARLGRREQGPVMVRRDGQLEPVEPSKLVVGDIVQLRAGDVVPADLRVLEGGHLEVDESPLTGESTTVRKGPEPVVGAEVAERVSMMYEGTSIAAGDPLGAVVAVGADTEARRGLRFAPDAPDTGVEARLRSLTAFMLPVSVLSGAGVVAIGLLRRVPLRDTLGAGVSLAVAAVPEGLPLLATVAQLGAARRLSHRNALVRNPRALEALGRVDVLCADKTGTLTAGAVRLQVVSDGDDAGDLGSLTARQRDVLVRALRAGPALDVPGGLAHPTDRAFVEAARTVGVSEQAGATRWTRRHELPFAPERSYHATAGHDGESLRLFVKGAPERLLPRCTRRVTERGVETIDEGTRAELQRHVERLARRGLRVLAVAETDAPDGRLHDRHVRDLALSGFVGLSDPVRPSAAAAIAGLRRAGIGVVMITGDHPSTAEGVAVDLELLDDGVVITGSELDTMDDAHLDDLLARIRVFARVTPAHKVRIVHAFQRAGRVVAMTGDGANDAPAIRLADVGIALGEESTPAARDAADVVVVDERLETIVDAVVESRAMWASVRDAISILVGGNAGELAFTLMTTVVTGSSPLNARQLLLVNLVTDGLPAMAIALRRPRSVGPEQLLTEGPEASLGGPLTRSIVIRGAATAMGASAAYALARLTGTRARASTVSLVALTGAQLGQTLVVGGRDPLVAATALGSSLLLAVVVQTPGISRVFGCRPIGPFGWMIATTSAAGATIGAVAAPRAWEFATRFTRATP